MKPKMYEEWQTEKKKPFKKIKLNRTVSIHEREAEDMNCDTWCTGIRYFEAKAQVTVDTDFEKEKTKLWDVINKLDVDIRPHHASGIEKLKAFIEEHKNK